MEMENMIYNRYRGYVESFVCNKGTTASRAVNNIKTGLKKGEIGTGDVSKILDWVFEHNIKISSLYDERKERFDVIKNEINNTVFASP